jgi:poly(hydroxyalkanoate) depolymerase family esterase
MRGPRFFWWKWLKRALARIAARVPEAPVPEEPGLSAPPQPDSALAPGGGTWVSTHGPSRVNGARPRTRRAYSLYLPPAARRSRLPLVVMLHGCGQTAAEFAQGTRMNQLAGEHDFVVLYPEQSAAAHRHRCWHWYDPATQGGTGDTALIAAMIETVVAEYAIDRSRIYAAGLSAGASMAHILALRRPELIAAVGLHSGVAFGAADSATAALAAMRHGTLDPPATALHAAGHSRPFPAMPAVLIHGSRDGVVSPINLAHLTEQFRALTGATARMGHPAARGPATLPAGAGETTAHAQRDYYVGDELMLRVCEVPGLAHAWSGGDGAFAFHSSEGPDASALMWDFFKLHRRPVSSRARSGAAVPPAWKKRGSPERVAGR